MGRRHQAVVLMAVLGTLVFRLFVSLYRPLHHLPVAQVADAGLINFKLLYTPGSMGSLLGDVFLF